MSYEPIFCQQCKEPLQVKFTLLAYEALSKFLSLNKLDASLIDLAPSSYDMIVATLPSSPPNHARQPSELKKLAQTPSPSSAKSAWQRSRNVSSSSKTPSSLSTRAQGKQPQRGSATANSPLPNESFVLLQDSVIRDIPSPITSPARSKKGSLKLRNSPAKAQNTQADKPFEPDHNPSPLSHHLRSTARLFNILSTRTDIDHPLCAECTQILLATLQRQLDETKKERDGYIAFEKEVRKERERDGQSLNKEEADKKIEKLKGEERSAIDQLKEAEREREQLDEELKLLELDEKALELEESE